MELIHGVLGATLHQQSLLWFKKSSFKKHGLGMATLAYVLSTRLDYNEKNFKEAKSLFDISLNYLNLNVESSQRYYLLYCESLGENIDKWNLNKNKIEKICEKALDNLELTGFNNTITKVFRTMKRIEEEPTQKTLFACLINEANYQQEQYAKNNSNNFIKDEILKFYENYAKLGFYYASRELFYYFDGRKGRCFNNEEITDLNEAAKWYFITLEIMKDKKNLGMPISNFNFFESELSYLDLTENEIKNAKVEAQYWLNSEYTFKE